MAINRDMSQLELLFQTKDLTGLTYTEGSVNIEFTVGGLTHQLNLNVVYDISTTGNFQRITHGTFDEDFTNTLQATAFIEAFNRDFRNVGGTNNLVAEPTETPGEVIINAELGTFDNYIYTGDSLIITIALLGNTAEPVLTELTVERTDTGDCSTIDYNISANNDNAPFDLYSNGSVIAQDWDGSVTTISLTRGVQYNISADDTTVTINVPRKLATSDFNIVETAYDGYSDINIKTAVSVEGTTPLEYSSDNVTFQSATSIYTGLLTGNYTFYVRDKYECVVSLDYVIVGQGTTGEVNQYDFFQISNLNSLSFAESTDDKKNPFNVLSYNDAVKLPQTGWFFFPSSEIIGTQFRSSYQYHNVTIVNHDKSRYNIPTILVQQNLGDEIKLDCKIFPVDNVTAVTFEGGNIYEPNTTTVLTGETHPYNGNSTPEWADIGQEVNIEGIGTIAISDTGLYDESRDVFYFTVDAQTTAEETTTIPVTFDRHEYNIFEFYFDANLSSGKSFVYIEAGYDSDNIARTSYSEPFEIIEDSEKYLKMEWGAEENVGDMVYAGSSNTGVAHVVGKMRQRLESESETADGVEKDYSLNQSASIGVSVELPNISPLLAAKINAVSGLSKWGYFKINGLELIKDTEPEAEEQGDTNIIKMTLGFSYGGDLLAKKDKTAVLNVSTGIEGTGETTLEQVEATEPIDLDAPVIYTNESGDQFYFDDDGNVVTL